LYIGDSIGEGNVAPKIKFIAQANIRRIEIGQTAAVPRTLSDWFAIYWTVGIVLAVFCENTMMLQNNWRIAWRFLVRNKIYTGIHILGLALGISGCLVIFLITHFELSFDRHHPDGNRIYRIVGNIHRPDGEEGFLNSPTADVAGFETQIPGLEGKAGIFEFAGKIGVPQAGQPEKTFDNHLGDMFQHTAVITSSSYFAIFQRQWLAGNANTLDQPDHVVLTEGRGRLYFGDISPASMIGKTVVYDDSLPVHVSGIVKDEAGNTDLGYTDYISIATATHSFLKSDIPTTDWTSLRPHQSMAFVRLAAGVTPEQVNARFADYVKRHVKLRRAGVSMVFYLQPLKDLHFTRDFHRNDDGDLWRKVYPPTIYALIGVAIFILLIAAINFVNLSTAQSMSRAKEVGVRKVMGSRKTDIRLQFLTETLLVTLLAAVLAVTLVNPLLALFHEYVPPGVHFELKNVATLVFLGAVVMLTTLLAGSYPAWIMARHAAVESLKGSVSGGSRGRLNLRRALIVFQFSISLVFIIGAIVIGKQMAFMRNSDKGFDTERVLTLSDWSVKPQQLQVFANAIRHLPGVTNVILEGTPPMGYAQNMDMFAPKPTVDALKPVSAHMGGEDYIPFYGMKLVAGRNIFHSDSLRELVINETLARQMGCRTPQEALGRILYASAPQGGIGKGYPVVGVVADFHVGSFHEVIPPAVIENVKERQQSVAVKLASADPKAVKAVMAGMEKDWKQQFPDQFFSAALLDESIGWLFQQEEHTAWLVNMATSVTIFISCMGLFGLGLFTTKRRAKEISIRKVLGASVRSITALLSGDFAWLVGIAFVVATPVAWWFGHQWLQDFAYRTGLSWWVFVLAGLGGMGIALLTVGLQAMKTAMSNPVEFLRNE
jgi:ABC-type lipoprotein release transport system permease subunit